MCNEIEEHFIPKIKESYFLNNGYHNGRLPLPKENYGKHVEGCLRINNGTVEKVVKEEDLVYYLDNGWILGRLKFKDTSNFKGSHPKRVLCVETGEIYESIAKATSITRISTIRRCVKGLQETAGKYHWILLEDIDKNT